MITEKDLNILDLLSQGYNQSEISSKLEISLSNVEKSIKSSKTFLGAKSLFHLGVIYSAVNKITMKFKDAPIGTRFKYPNTNKIWVKINSFPKSNTNDGLGLICSWNGNSAKRQSFCHFVDKERNIDYDTLIEIL